MTPAARVQAAIEILDDILSGAPVEKALTGWARRSRFAGSNDRAAIRDHVFYAIRNRRSFAALGGAPGGRGLMIGLARAQGLAIDMLFSGDRHAPAPVGEDEAPRAFASEAERLDIPDWLWPEFTRSLRDEAEAAAQALKSRAPVHLRVNLQRTTRAKAITQLAQEGISAQAHPACDTALEVTEGARKIAQSHAYKNGTVELQDAASQAVVASIPLKPGLRVLDYCAGGGGKALAIAARDPQVEVFAHDANPGRMRDLPARAERAGANIPILSNRQLAKLAPFDVVLTDVPCSGSGSWRRAPAGKWSLTQDALRGLTVTQGQILRDVIPLVAEKGILAYATCSVLAAENQAVVDAFLQACPDWTSNFGKAWRVSHGTDGFFCAHLTRK
ncbi:MULTISPECIES: RsmB/NOP family class I SAM-dependent RNA methyltransferase [unclassified Ruegeria]|uniref:RsmB/NOP family class I SAM-dependent RNA methyltransferase n=1 Tax=unclassified Ruegeria TaxID=2625375 RepID=UPI001488368F|nr:MULTISPECIES: RsmB/NOP family class I SAM-dependent RNA methyltransferase [unclassified Ruegeria]